MSFPSTPHQCASVVVVFGLSGHFSLKADAFSKKKKIVPLALAVLAAFAFCSQMLAVDFGMAARERLRHGKPCPSPCVVL